MRQRKRAQREPSETTTKELPVEIGDDGERKGFYACYLLVSLSPRHKGHTYIGFTVNPRRRIRQHNGEIGCGAWRTKKRRPWEMVLCIHGFPSNVSALQFEWAWQHPNESLAVRKAAASFKSLSGIANKIKLAYTMLTLPSWQSLNIAVNYFSTKYTQHSAGCLSLPQHMKVKICPMDELPCYVKGDESLFENEDEWDNEERDEACSGSESAEETLSNSMFGNTEEHDKNGFVELYGWITEGEDCREQSTFAELPARPSSNVSSSGSLAGEFTDDTGISGLIKGDSFKSKQPAKEPSKSVVTIDDDQPPSNHIVPSEVEVIDVTTPSPLCRSSLWGNKANKRARNKEHHNALGAEETLSNSMFGNTEEHDKNGLGELYGWITEGEDCREQSTFAELPARPSSNVSNSGSLAGEFTDDTGISGLIKDDSFKSKRPAKEPSKSVVTIDDDQPPSNHIVPSEVEVIDVTTPSPLCRSSLWGNKANKRARNKEHHNVLGEVEVVDLTTPSPLCRSSLWSDLFNYA